MVPMQNFESWDVSHRLLAVGGTTAQDRAASSCAFGLRVFAEPRVAEALIWLVQMTRGSPFARCWSTAPEVASYRRQGPHPPRPSGPNQGTCRGRVRRLIQPRQVGALVVARGSPNEDPVSARPN